MKQKHPRIKLGNPLLIAILVILSSCRSAPLYNANNVSISPRLSASEIEIAEAIWSAGRRLGWKIERVGKGQLKAVKHIRNHSASVMIHFSQTSFDITYYESENLDFDGENIHENYNVWIQRLAKKIQNEIAFRLPETSDSM